MKRKELYNDSTGKSVGELGEFAFEVDGVNFYVGDIVTFDTQKPFDGHTHYAGVITTHKGKEPYGICNGYIDSVYNVNIKRVVPYNLVTREILDFCKNTHILIRDIPVKEMTLAEIEKELGYKIEIVEELDEDLEDFEF
ncbi:hypothetical protein PQE66_gp092 [Bacillus phage PBC2]|uniref:Uncharacterized protein n=1 Tax=Bacillus phage PBC2 TaxID=1675029 RepID=A0A218KBZ2_9CAUD|nr:hypothetical protein PQE66_gp092 [Bacillus phage PBC2]AKQ08407.1 hypothetical protein PBC2_092 [Bacillus phage PBC2]